MTKKILCIALALGALSCAKQNKEWTIEVANPTQIERMDEGVVLTRAQLKPADNVLLPAVKDVNGNYLPSQVDDLDGDGQWDELAFILNLSPAETANLQIVWVNAQDYPHFPVRTNVRYGKMTSPGKIEELKSDVHYKDEVYELNVLGYPYQMDGVAWENDYVGFRHYYDGRNNKDYFGKRTTDMVLDGVGIRENGYPGDTYHVWADWGRDIMSVGTSFGIGGIAGWTDDNRFLRLGRASVDVPDIIDSTRYTLVFEGPVRSRFALDFYGWEIEGDKVNLRQEATIWAGKHNYENKVIAPKLPAGVSLITGFLYNFNDLPLEEIDLSKVIVMASHDHQTYNKEFIMGEALILPKTGVKELFKTLDFIPEDQLSRTWCAKLNLDSKGEVEYKAYATWEHQDSLFRNRDYFLNFINIEGEKADNPVSVTLK